MVSSVTSTHKSYQPFESFWTSCSICFLHRPGTLQEGDQKFLIVIFGKVTNSKPCTITKMDISRPTFFFHSYSLINSVISLPGPSSEAFFSRLQNRGVRIWQDVEIFPQHAVFIAQQMLDQILRICKSFLKSGFFEHIWYLLFQNPSSYIYNNKLFCSL